MRKRIVIIGIAGVVAFLAAGFLIPAYRAPRLSRSLVVCESNLRNIQLAKQSELTKKDPAKAQKLKQAAATTGL